MCEQNPDFRVGRYETRAEQPLDEGAWPWETPGSWRGAGGYRAAPYLRGPRSRVSSHARLLGGARGGFVSLTQTAPASAHPARRPLEPLGPANEVGKWPDQSGQSRLCRTLSEFVEVGEAIERRSAKENVTVTTSYMMGASCAVGPFSAVSTS